MLDIIIHTWQGLGRASSAMRGLGAVLWCCCLAACLASGAQARRELLITDQEAQSALDTVFSSAGDIVGQVGEELYTCLCSVAPDLLQSCAQYGCTNTESGSASGTHQATATC